MIAKLIKGRGFRGALEYALRKDKGVLLDTNMGGDNPRTLAREFGQVRALRSEISRPVQHTSLALPPGETLTNDQWKNVAQRYLNDMGFVNNQYVIAKHTDAGHDHIHILVNRISIEGKLVSDSKDYQRQETIMRQLENEYGLTPVKPSKEATRRRPTKGELEHALRTGAPSTKMMLQKLVDKALEGQPELSAFTAKLEAAGVTISPNIASTGRISGISFTLNNTTMKGSDLGRGYTWAGLQKRGLAYEQIRITGPRDRATYSTPTARNGIQETEHGEGSLLTRNSVDRRGPESIGQQSRQNDRNIRENDSRYQESIGTNPTNSRNVINRSAKSETGGMCRNIPSAKIGTRDSSPSSNAHSPSNFALKSDQMGVSG